MFSNYDYFITSMPDRRPADIYLGCLEGSVFIDFNKYDKDRLVLKRISFDGYGCYELNNIKPLNQIDSKIIKEMFANGKIIQNKLSSIIKKILIENKEQINQDALKEYGFL